MQLHEDAVANHPVIDALLAHVEGDTVPETYVSSHWRYHSHKTRVERHAGGLRLQADGFEVVSRMGIRGRLLHTLERWYYVPVTSRLPGFPEVWTVARHLVRDLSGDPNLTVLKSVCALSILEHHWSTHGLSPKTFALIGDGYGFLGALIRRRHPHVRIYCMDLQKILVFQVRTHRLADPTATITLLSRGDRRGSSDVTCVLPHEIEDVPEMIDCAINISSMFEMNAVSLASYFRFLRRRSTPTSHFYCVNGKQKKQLYGGDGVAFADYPWRPDDQMFLDGPCPYFRLWFSPSTRPGRRPEDGGPKVVGIRVPFVNYCGPTMHRLVHLAPQP